ncbi:MAG: ribosome rescue protein RqcH [Thermoplasmatota archaeon]
MKEEMESLEISAAVNELKSLIGGYTQKIYRPNKKELLFRIHVPGKGKKMLIFRIGKALYLTEKDRDNPMHPGDFIMLIRKYIGNASITDIYQHEFDRVVVMELRKKRKFRLIFEVFGKGNLILDGEDRILLPYRSESWSHRELKKGELYKFPPKRLNPLHISREELIQILEDSDKDLVRTLAVDLNIGGKYSEEICSRLNVDKNSEEFLEYTEGILEVIDDLKIHVLDEDRLDPVLVKEDNEIIDAVPFPLSIYENYEVKETNTYNEALDKAFPKPEEKIEEEKKEDSRLDRKLEQQKRAVKNLKESIVENKNIAEIIYQNYKECEKTLSTIHKARDEGNRVEIYEKLRGKDVVVQVNDKDEYIIMSLKGVVDENKIEKNVKLDFRKDVNENAQKYYNKSKKSKKKLEGARKAVKRTEKQIEEGKAKKIEKKTIEPTEKFWFDKYKWFISSEDNIVIAGKDTKTNEEVVKKYMENDSRYAHAEAGGAPSVVVKNDTSIDEPSLIEACQYSLIHSKEWKRGIASGRAYWVKPNQVSKTAEAGESLPTGAFVIRGKRNYLDNLPLEAILIEIEYKGHRKVMCAPSLLLKNKDEEFLGKKVKFIPGKKDQNEFAKEMSKYFEVPVSEVQNILPPGGVKIMDK